MAAEEQKNVAEQIVSGVVFAVLVGLIKPVFAPLSWLELIVVGLVAGLLIIPINRFVIWPVHKSLREWRDNL